MDNSHKKNLNFSIIICTHNSKGRVAKTVKSVINQNYPSDDYEIIVINDGSTDHTVELLEQFKILVITNKINRGIGYSRNLGLKKSKGKIVAYIDDDCTADPNWLKTINNTYIENNPMSVGGHIEIYGNNITNQFLRDSGYGKPTPLYFQGSRSPMSRFIMYIKNNVTPSINSDKLVEVLEIYTANATYLRSALSTIGGFDENLLSCEDSDVSRRLKQKFPSDCILYQPLAKVVHTDNIDFISYIIKKYKRSRELVNYYKKINKTIPIFPLPLLFLCLIVNNYLFFQIPFYILLLSPSFLYFWWTFRFFLSGNTKYIIYPYLQLGTELAILVGMLTRLTKIN